MWENIFVVIYIHGRSTQISDRKLELGQSTWISGRSTSAHKFSEEADLQDDNKQTQSASTIFFSDDYVLLSQTSFISSVDSSFWS